MHAVRLCPLLFLLSFSLSLQLFRALMRKEKPIEAGDASAVAAVHVAVTDNTWQCIMEYEKLHAKSVAKRSRSGSNAAVVLRRAHQACLLILLCAVPLLFLSLF